MSIAPSDISFNEIVIKIKNIPYSKLHFDKLYIKASSAIYQLFCSGPNVLSTGERTLENVGKGLKNIHQQNKVVGIFYWNIVKHLLQ